MTKELVKKVNDYNKHNMPCWELEDYGTCEGVAAKDIVTSLDEYYGNDWDKTLRTELVIEACKEAIKADPKYFDDAETGWFCDDMVEGWGDIYFSKGLHHKSIGRQWLEDGMTENEIRASLGDIFSLDDNGYYLADCRAEPTVYYKVER